MRLRVLRGAPVGAPALLIVLSCRQIVGIDDHLPGPAGGDATPDARAEATATCGGFPWTVGGCEACMQNACCSQAKACRGDLVCAAAFDCISACAGGDDACRTACISPRTEDDAMAALASCQAASCDRECGLHCGGIEAFIGGPVPSPYDAGARGACFACQASPSYCAALEAFASCPGCLAAQLCAQRCVGFFDTICIQDCAVEYPAGGPGYDAGVVSVLGSACQSACPSGTNWYCLGHVVWPQPATRTVTFRMTPTSIADASNGPVPGAKVRLCDLQDPTCDAPLSTAPVGVDSAGVATLTLTAPFRGYFEVTAANYLTTLFVFTPTIAESMLPGSPPVLVEMVPLGEFSSLVGAAGGTPDMSKGYLYAAPYDCAGEPAPDVAFSAVQLGSSAVAYYMVNGVPDGNAKSTSPGVFVGGGFDDVDPGLVTLTASVGGIPFAAQGAPIRAGALTGIYLVPSK